MLDGWLVCMCIFLFCYFIYILHSIPKILNLIISYQLSLSNAVGNPFFLFYCFLVISQMDLQ